MTLLWEMSAERENAAIRRCLVLNFHQLLIKAGVPRTRFGTIEFYGAWCALNLPRRVIFEDNKDGDVDVLAGPLAPAFNLEQLNHALKEARDRFGPMAHESRVLELASMVLLEKYGVVWPPQDRTVVALEAKASRFSYEAHEAASPGDPHAPQDGWKGSHKGESGRVLGQLSYLIGSGVDAVSFLQLGATKPRDDSAGHAWFVAGQDASTAEDCVHLVFDPTSTPYGYFLWVVGAIEGKSEDWAGAGPPLRIMHEPELQNGADNEWKTAFFDKLARLSAPTSLSPIIGCGSDGQLRWEAGIHEALMTEPP